MSPSLALLVAALLAADAPAPRLPPPSSSELPPDHPPISGPPRPARPLPPGAGQGTPAGQLPPDHPPVTGQSSGPTSPADQLVEQLDRTPGLKEKEKTFEVAHSLGRVYYGAGRFADALVLLGQADGKAEQLRALFLAQKKKVGKRALPEATQAVCGYPPEAPLEAKTGALEARASRGEAAAVAACGRGALEPALEVALMQGNALFLTGEPARALERYERVLQVAPSHPEALFGRATVLLETRGEDVKALRAARTRELAELAGQAAQTGGRQKLVAQWAVSRPAPPPAPAPAPAPGGGDTPQVSAETLEALRKTEVTPEMRQRFGQLLDEGEEHLARGRYQQAVESYRQVMPFEPSPRVQAGLAWALIGLGRPNAQRVWDVAVGADPAAVERLGDALKAKNDEKGARGVWARLAETAPDYASRSGLQAKLQ